MCFLLVSVAGLIFSNLYHCWHHGRTKAEPCLRCLNEALSPNMSWSASAVLNGCWHWRQTNTQWVLLLWYWTESTNFVVCVCVCLSVCLSVWNCYNLVACAHTHTRVLCTLTLLFFLEVGLDICWYLAHLSPYLIPLSSHGYMYYAPCDM